MRPFLSIACLLLVLQSSRLLLGDESITRPNVVVILCDDLGYGDLGCFGHPTIKTPNLDRFATQGIRLTSCYSAAPVCSSSRAGLLTGRNPNRLGIYDWLPDGIPVWLRIDEMTLPRMLRDAGYRTAMVGKWHLNGMFNLDQQPQPDDYGFEHWMATQNNAAPSHQSPVNFVRNGTAIGKQPGFSCQVVADESIKWLQSVAKSDSPFYLHVCFHEPHEPVESPKDLVDSYRKVALDEDQAQYFANVANMDAACGRIFEALEGTGRAKDTLVFFSSDNGPETLNRYPTANRSYGSPGPLKGMKLHVTDGGIRVSGIVRYPARFAAGIVSDEPIGSVDLLPTVGRLIGNKQPITKPLDGADASAFLSGKAATVARERPLFWWYYRAISEPRFALRDGKWKLIATWDGPTLMDRVADRFGSNINPKSMQILKTAKLKDFSLYDLNTDIGENNDLAQAEPEQLARLQKIAIEIYDEVQAEAPVWEGTQEYWARAKAKR